MSSDIAVRVRDLGKKYRIGHQDRRGQTSFRDALAAGVKRISKLQFKPQVNVEEFWALKSLSVDIRRGEVVGIIGRNGAGKSTLLKLLSRITDPTTGSIEFSGRIASLLEVGTGFHNDLTGRENIFLNGAILGMPSSEIRRKFDEIVDFSGIEQFLDTPVKHYSSGMYMRLAFAVAAHLEPDILLIDEVLAVGDAEFQKKCLGKMREVASDLGRTVIFVSHNMQSVRSLCGHAIHLENGRLVAYGATDDVVRDYLRTTSTSPGRWVNPAPDRGGDDFRLLSIETSDSQNSGGTYFSSGDLKVTMTFRLLRVLPALCVGFDLVTPDGTTVFRSYQTDLAEHEWPQQTPGTHSWTCRIPAGFLNSGEYFISPRVSIHNTNWIFSEDSVLQFEVVLDHGVSPFWNSLSGTARPGVIAPILEWTADSPGEPDFTQDPDAGVPVAAEATTGFHNGSFVRNAHTRNTEPEWRKVP